MYGIVVSAKGNLHAVFVNAFYHQFVAVLGRIGRKIHRAATDFDMERSIVSVPVGWTALTDISIKPYGKRVFFKPGIYRPLIKNAVV